ncbi:MBOAT family protein [Aquihabitans sp. G128]|uniref:MBOAT family O-acyltransferase n=1 Tax=Aquihabitans sp. G128 TaxID=2849779 RepID=UPI001C22DABD|nr:MBOAT family protein [Aquihabitans sp. G128]QXC61217.1 MBOAT family protein [Aquihabitans sp. G128]
MLFPTIRFAMFFAVVMPASWLLMPLPGRSRQRGGEDHTQPWIVPTGLIAAAALLGPLAPSGGWPTALKVLLWLAALGIAGVGVVRWFDLKGLTRWNVFILFASYVFYGNYNWHFVALLAGSTVVNQVLAGNIHRQDDERSRRLWLIVAVALNLGVLGWFKYKGFFTESASSALEPLGIHFVPPARAIIPPVGISFFTFQALSYVIDTYRRKLEPVPLLEFAVYLSFFPHLVAGPIVRASEFLPQLRIPRDARRVDSGLAFWLIAVGLFKKVVVSSYLASASVDPVFRIPQNHQAVDTLIGIYGYAIQIYCDFSGYTDMAIGLALLLGFRFPQNFDAPYTSASLQEFWRRWHMTLSRWLRDYLYIPLGGNQRGPNRALLNLFLTMLIGGLWHGAAWTFIVWGALHGGWLAAERWLKDRPKAEPALGPDVGAPPARPSRPPVGASARARARARLSGALDGDPGEAAVDPDATETDLVVRTDDAQEAAAVPFRPSLPSLDSLSPTTRLWLGRLVTFHVVCLGWVFFRAPTLTEAFAVLKRLTHLGTGSGINLVVVATIAVFLASQFVPSDAVGKAQATFSRMPVLVQGVILAVWLAFTSALAPAGVLPFIYFAF